MPAPVILRRSGVAAAAVVVLLGVWACSVSGTGPDAGVPVEGRWTWVRSTGGLLPRDRTPETEGFDMTLVFGADGVLRVLYDGSPGGETWYEVGVGSAQGALEGTPVFRYGEPLFGFQEQAYRFATPDSLELADGCCDGFTWYFVREAGP